MMLPCEDQDIINSWQFECIQERSWQQWICHASKLTIPSFHLQL